MNSPEKSQSERVNLTNRQERIMNLDPDSIWCKKSLSLLERILPLLKS